MNISDILQGSGGIEAMANQLGITPQEAERGAGALLPSILHGFGQRAQPDAASGGGGLEDVLGQLGGGNLAANVTSPGPTEVDKGNKILGHIFGSKAVSRQVAGEAAPAAGLDPAILKKMLPILAMLVGGYLSNRSREGGSGGLGGVLGSIIGGLAGGRAGGGMGGGLGSVLGGMLGSKL
ncbi:DUF937 domain-containing protein [Novosphingobium tardum]|uniref:DUF937 domain-containing protein n=1 Tax=Novosphingobium tardum TaxID=1538021 RepID=A0ABV8RPK2_9SPHN